jgi:CelD/BcsL family acetyltransferase involved in cellulose biosynthesis
MLLGAKEGCRRSGGQAIILFVSNPPPGALSTLSSVSLQVSVITPSDLGPREIELWIQFQQRSHLTLNPFLSPTFARVVGRARDAARVAIIEVDGCIEGFLAFEAADGIARPIGWPANDLQGFIHSGITIEARAIVKLAGLRGWRFHHAIANQPELVGHQYSGLTLDCPVIIATDFDAYLASRSSSLRREFGRRQRGLERDYGCADPLEVIHL